MRIAGIDPGYGRCGYGIIEHERNKSVLIAYGCIETPAGMDFSDRLKLLSDELTSIFALHEPEVMGVEELFFAKNTTTAMKVAHARGVILLAAANAGMKAREFKPAEIKQALTGHGRADKQQIQQMTKLLLGLAEIPKPDDAADALAVALTASMWKPFIRN